MQNDEIDLGPYWRATRKRFTLVIASVIVCGLIAAGITYLLKAKYQCDAVLLLPIQSNSTSPLASLLKSEVDPLEMMKGVIESEATLDYLHDQTGIKTEELKKMVGVQTQKDQNQVLITCAYEKPAVAKQIVVDCIATLYRLTSNGNLDLASMQAKILERDLDKRTRQLFEMEERLKRAAKDAKAPIDPTDPFSADLRKKAEEAKYEYQLNDEQISTALAAASKMSKESLTLPTALPNQESLREKLEQLQYDLETATIQLGSENPQVKALEQQIDITKNLIKSEVAKYLTAAHQGIDPALAQLYGQKVLLGFQKDYLTKMSNEAPDEALSASRMFQEVSAEQDAWKFVREQYEEDKVNGLINPLQWTTLVPPYIEDKPVNKRYGLYSAVGAIAGFFIGTILAYWRESKSGKRKGHSAPNAEQPTPVGV